MARKNPFGSKKDYIGDNILNKSSLTMKKLPIRDNRNIPLDEIQINQLNCFSQSDIEELARSIEMIGLQHPIVLSKLEKNENGKKYKLQSGERRYNAYQFLLKEGKDNYSTIPSTILEELPDDLPSDFNVDIYKMYKIAVTNEQIREETPRDVLIKIEAAEEFYKEAIRTNYKLETNTVREFVSNCVNISESKIRRIKRIVNKLIPELKDLYLDGKLSLRIAYAIRNRDSEQQKSFYFNFKEDIENILYETYEDYFNRIDSDFINKIEQTKEDTDMLNVSLSEDVSSDILEENVVSTLNNLIHESLDNVISESEKNDGKEETNKTQKIHDEESSIQIKKLDKEDIHEIMDSLESLNNIHINDYQDTNFSISQINSLMRSFRTIKKELNKITNLLNN